MAPHSSTLAWKIPWMKEPGRLQSMGSLRVRHDWVTSLSLFTFPALEKEMATHSSVLALRIPGTGKPGGLPSMGSHRVGHDWSDLAAVAAATSLKGMSDFPCEQFQWTESARLQSIALQSWTQLKRLSRHSQCFLRLYRFILWSMRLSLIYPSISISFYLLHIYLPIYLSF